MMATSGLDRRSVLQAAGLWAAGIPFLTLGGLAAGAQGDSPETVEGFSADLVKRTAQQFAQRAFSKPKIDLPEPFDKLNYEQYRDIRFRKEQAIWAGEGLDYELQLFALGYLFDVPVDIWIVEGTKARLLKADGTYFSIGPSIGNAPQAAPFGFSGFRVHGPINRADVLDEYAVFQGASYFRAVGRGESYGLSARGLAVNVGKPPGEEFVFFRSFWIEKPKQGALEIIAHALLDGPSTTGAYRFSIQPGASVIMDVEATLYPRRDIAYAGLAPLTSMFKHGPASKRVNGDYRPAVHNSEGLAILNGSGERIWRPLTNPKTLQVSAFSDKEPKGFGLIQRDRNFSNYEDIDAMYEHRPSLWVEPRGGWGEGYVELLEIPADEEIHDNIVAYWRPARPIDSGRPYTFSYRLHWGDTSPIAPTGARVRKTRIGNTRKGNIQFVIDFDGPGAKEPKDLPVADVKVSAGTASNVVVQRNPEIGGLRCSFDLQTASADLIELRLVLKTNDRPVSESWVYRWTKS